MGRATNTPTTQAIAYYRVSTQKQGESGLGLEAQRAAVATYARQAGLAIVAEFTEIESGKRDDRPEVARAIAQCRATGARLLIAKLDRLARSVSFISTLRDSGIAFTACDMPAANDLIVNVMAAVAQAEREMISARTRAALAAARARGTRLGNPGNLNAEARAKGPRAKRTAAIDAYAGEVRNILRMRDAGMTLRAIADDLNASNKTTREGARYTAATVSRILRRLDYLNTEAR